MISEDHFTVDGTLLQAWAFLKSFRPKDDEEPPRDGGGRKLRYLRVVRNQLWLLMAIAGYNLVRIAKLSAQPS